MSIEQHSQMVNYTRKLTRSLRYTWNRKLVRSVCKWHPGFAFYAAMQLADSSDEGKNYHTMAMLARDAKNIIISTQQLQ